MTDVHIKEAPIRVCVREDEHSVRILIAKDATLTESFTAALVNKNIAYLSEEVHDAIIHLSATIGVAFAEQILGLSPTGVEIRTPAEEKSAGSPEVH